MAEISALKDASFLRKLDLENIKTFYVKILVLDKNELPSIALVKVVENALCMRVQLFFFAV